MIDLPKCQTFDGNNAGTNGGSAPQIFVAAASSTRSTPTVAINRASGEALRIRRNSS